MLRSCSSLVASSCSLLLLLWCAGCTSIGGGGGNAAAYGGRPVEVEFETKEQHVLATQGTTSEAGLSKVDAPDLSATVYVLDELEWDTIGGAEQFTKLRRARADGDAVAEAKLHRRLLDAVEPWRIEGVKTPCTTKVQPQPQILVAARGDQLAYRVFDALDERSRHVDITFD